MVASKSGLPIEISSSLVMFTLGINAEYLGREMVLVKEARTFNSSLASYLTSKEEAHSGMTSLILPCESAHLYWHHNSFPNT